MKIDNRTLAFLCLTAITATTHAESLSPKTFQFKGGQLGYIERGEVYSAWNANDPSSVLKPGMKVMFFGRAEGCDLRAGNGPVKNQGGPRFAQTLALTGIPVAPEGKGQRWAPSGDTEQCDKSVRDQIGDSFVHVNQDPVNGGIGIFTFTGPDQHGRRSFFRQFDKGGKNGTGANANIEGSFVAFRFDWQKGNTVYPWAGDGQPLDRRAAEFRTVQSVVVASVGDDAVGRGNEPVQAKQQFIAAFINRGCFQNAGERKGLCQLQYLFNTAVYRAGIKDWESAKWFKSAGLFADPAQGGMPVVHGPVGRRGESAVDQASGLELYTSLGEPSHHDIFKDKEFRIRISFAQLKNALRLVAAKSLKISPAQVSPMDMATVFSKSWDDPNEWMLLSVNVSQEVHNPYEGVNAHLGGAIREISVGVAASD